MDREERSEYNKMYYANNRERILEYRKKLYQKNNEYRDRILKSSTLSQKIDTLSQGTVCQRYTKVEGSTELLFALHQLARIFHRDSSVFIQLATLCPKPKCEDKKLYTTSQGKMMNLVRWEMGIRDERILRKVFKVFWDKKFNEEDIRRYVKKECDTKEKRYSDSERADQRSVSQ